MVDPFDHRRTCEEGALIMVGLVDRVDGQTLNPAFVYTNVDMETA